MKRQSSRRRMAGFTLIEMMISMVVGLVVISAVVAVQKAFESQRRTSVSGNDLDNAGAYALAQIDSLVRSAGSGFSQGYQQSYGCELYANNGGTALLPAGGAFASPFDNVLGSAGTWNSLGGAVRVAPLVILPKITDTALLNQGNGQSDVLMVMGGTGAEANVQTLFSAPAASGTVTLQSGAGFHPNDLIMLIDAAQASGPATCQINQVGTITALANGAQLNLSGTMVANPTTATATSPYGMSIDASAVPIGNSVGNYPTFQLIGVGANSQLTSYDMLQLINAAPVAIGDSVMELHALYLTANGVGTSPCGAACIGVDPSKTAAYNPSTLLNGTTAATAALATIKAVRIGLILKSPLMEKLQGPSGALTHVGPPTLTLFSDVPDATGTPGNLTYTRTLDPTGLCSATAPLPQCELDFRYRTMEITIPLRNPMMIS